MDFNQLVSDRRRAGQFALLTSLILISLVLAACTSAQPGAAVPVALAQVPATATVASTQASPVEQPSAVPTETSAPAQDVVASTPAQGLTQSAEAGAVMVDITPLNLGDPKASAFDYKVAMNTHSVDLGVDLATLAVLKVGANEIAADVWQGPAGGGHHIEGVLSFPSVTADGRSALEGATSVTVVIRNLAGVPERAFTWNLWQPDAANDDKMAMSTTPPDSGLMPMDRGDADGMGMSTGNAVTNTNSMSGTMPMSGDMMGMMGDGMQGMMSEMQDMMAGMKDMPPAEQQKMMVYMMGMMQGMVGGMSQEDSDQMMPHMMTMMNGMMGAMGSGEHEPAAQHDMDAMDDSAGKMDHTAAIPAAGVPDAIEQIGGQPLAFKVENGVKVFDLTASPVLWPILDTVKVTAWAYNGSVPGPMIRVTEGDKVRIILKNGLPEATSIHWHGMPVPNAMDGLTPIQPGESFTYEFVAPPAGSFMYHSHVQSDKQVGLGLYAPFIVDPKTPAANEPDVDLSWMLSEWHVGVDGQTYPAMPMMGAEPNYFTMNGKSYPNTQPIEIKLGQRVRVRLANVGQFTHPMHLHGMNFKIVAYDGVPLPPEQQVVRNTVPVNPGELVDIEFVADNPGVWMFHCHVLHHVTNDGAEPGGLVALVKVTQ